MYLLITRSSLLMIVFLVAAPVFDFYRFGRFEPAGGAALPIGAILPTARGASTTAPDPPDATEPPAGQPAAAAPASAGPATPTAEPARAASFRPQNPRPTAPSAARRSEFEAWTAAGQIDPFWDGNERPSSRAAVTGAAAPAPTAQEPAGSAAGSAAAGSAASGCLARELPLSRRLEQYVQMMRVRSFSSETGWCRFR